MRKRIRLYGLFHITNPEKYGQIFIDFRKSKKYRNYTFQIKLIDFYI